MIGVILLIVFFIFLGVSIVIIFIYRACTKKKTKSKSIDFKKEEPSPLYPPNQPYDSTQANTTPMQQPPYVLQPIPPEVANSDAIGYSSGTGPQGYYSGMAVQPS